MSRVDWDVIVIGAGPAGSAAATFLARMGRKVALFEKEHFPRFHIGESLLPIAMPILESLGLDLANAPYALKKEGALIMAESLGMQHRISFEETLPGSYPYAYQVDRDAFDFDLLNIAIQAGARAFMGQAVKKLEELEDRVRITTAEGNFSCRYLVDATGQNRLMTRQHGSRKFVRGMGSCATFTQYSGVTSPRARETFKTGDILLMLTAETSWSWLIPLPGNRLSVGQVLRDGMPIEKPDIAYARLLAGSPVLREILAGAERIHPIRRCSDFSYYTSPANTRRMCSVGDAHAFLDPVFSSGVSLGLFAAQSMAGELEPHLKDDSPLDLSTHHAKMKRGYLSFERVIERYYRAGWAFTTFFLTPKSPELVVQLNTIFSGDVWREDNDLQNKMLRAKPRTVSYVAEIPKSSNPKAPPHAYPDAAITECLSNHKQGP